MMENLQFSVCLCVYGKDDPTWFEIAANSILDQTAPPSEVVLVVDGPVPVLLDAVISKLEQQNQFRVVRLPSNQGHGVARRIGLEHCSYELIALMDSDDISDPERFEKQIRYQYSGSV